MSAATEDQHPTNFSLAFRRLVARHPVVAFLIMVYAIGWSTLIAAAGYFGLPMLLASSLAMVLGLALPTFLVTAAMSGKAGVRDLLGRCLRWRVGIGWYLLAVPGLLLATLLVASVFLGTAPLEALLEKWQLFFTMFLPSLLIPLVLTHLFEETGWTGFLHDTLQERHGPLLASIMVAPAFALFHFPLSFLEAPQITLAVAAFALFQLAVQGIVGIFFRVVITWLYNGTGRSVLIVALFHSAFNSAGAGADYATRFIEELITGPAALLIPIAVVAVIAVIIAVLTRGRLAYEPVRATRPGEAGGRGNPTKGAISNLSGSPCACAMNGNPGLPTERGNFL
jgi:membrane protease YdiL (CAAX protease family)